MFARKLRDEEYGKLKRHVVSEGQSINGDKCIFLDYNSGGTWLNLVMCFPDIDNRVHICLVNEVNVDGTMGRELKENDTVDQLEIDKMIKQLLILANKTKENVKNVMYKELIETTEVDCELVLGVLV